MTEERINPHRIKPASKAMFALVAAVSAEAESAGVEPEILEFVKLRASQLNHCAFCIDMHMVDARKLGISDQRLDLLPAWRETSLYSERERAAMELTEAMTLLPDDVSDEVWEGAAKVFSEDQLAVVVWAASVINALNRLGVTTRRRIPAR